MSAARHSLWWLQGRFYSLLLPVSVGCQHSLASGRITPIYFHFHIAVSSVLLLYRHLSIYRCVQVIWVIQHNLILRSLIHLQLQTPFLQKNVTFTGSGDLNKDISWGGSYNLTHYTKDFMFSWIILFIFILSYIKMQ